MVQTLSNMMPLGTVAPDFSLQDAVSGKQISLQAVRGEVATLIMFICNHCPFVKHIQKELINIGREYPAKGVGIIAISSNDVNNYPEDAPDKMKEVVISKGYEFPY